MHAQPVYEKPIEITITPKLDPIASSPICHDFKAPGNYNQFYTNQYTAPT
jgi:hypothetical protein